MLSKGLWRLTSLLVLLALLLAACGGGTTEAPSAEPEETEAPEEFVFGVILVGPKNDRGWSQAHYEGGLYIEENLPGARMIVFES